MGGTKPGKIVEFDTLNSEGEKIKQKGRTYNSEETMNGKIVVHYLDASFKEMIENGKPMKRLVAAERLKLIGFTD